jgi:3-methyladenine DNA glycosylase AlkD
LALLLLVRRFEQAGLQTQKPIYTFYLANTRFINNWDLVDLSAPTILGTYLYERDKRPLYRLSRSSSVWERRMSVLACFYFIKNNAFHDALRVAELLLTDEHDLIHKAVGWMLREIGKRNLAQEEAFLKSHCRNMPRTMLRYAIEKFPETKRLRYLKAV